MPRYENGIKFVDVRVRDATIVTSAGRTGGTFKTRETAYNTRQHAAERFAETIFDLKEKGFAHVSTLRTTAENRELERPLGGPDDTDARIVYGDWLLERGDPRGELIALQRQIAVARPAKAATLRNREREFLEEHSSVLLGPLDELLHVETDAGTAVVLAWRLGFLDAVALQFPVVRTSRLPSLAQALAMVTNLHSARFLRDLALGGSTYVADALAAVTRWPPPLRSFTVNQLRGSPIRYGHLTGFCNAHPQLERLDLAVDVDPLVGLSGPCLRHLVLRARELTIDQIRALAAQQWPALVSLDLPFAGTRPLQEPIDALFTRDRFPELATLRLRIPGIYMADIVSRAIARSLGDHLASVELVNASAEVLSYFTKRIARPIVSNVR